MTNQDKRAAAAKAVQSYLACNSDDWSGKAKYAEHAMREHADTIRAVLEQPQPPTGVDVIGVCNEYERGFGRATERKEKKNTNRLGSTEHAAYEYGYQEGKDRLEWPSVEPAPPNERIVELEKLSDGRGARIVDLTDRLQMALTELQLLRGQQAKQSPEPRTGNEVAWVIEMQSDGRPFYWYGSDFIEDHMQAIRFSRRDDAQQVVMEQGLVEAEPVEHMWCTAPETAKTQEELLALDRVLYGSSYERVNADGTRTRLDPREVIIDPNVIVTPETKDRYYMSQSEEAAMFKALKARAAETEDACCTCPPTFCRGDPGDGCYCRIKPPVRETTSDQWLIRKRGYYYRPNELSAISLADALRGTETTGSKPCEPHGVIDCKMGSCVVCTLHGNLGCTHPVCTGLY